MAGTDWAWRRAKQYSLLAVTHALESCPALRVTAASTAGLGSYLVAAPTVFNHEDGFAPFSDGIQDILAGGLGSKHPDKMEATDLLEFRKLRAHDVAEQKVESAPHVLHLDFDELNIGGRG